MTLLLSAVTVCHFCVTLCCGKPNPDAARNQPLFFCPRFFAPVRKNSLKMHRWPCKRIGRIYYKILSCTFKWKDVQCHHHKGMSLECKFGYLFFMHTKITAGVQGSRIIIMLIQILLRSYFWIVFLAFLDDQFSFKPTKINSKFKPVQGERVFKSHFLAAITELSVVAARSVVCLVLKVGSQVTRYQKDLCTCVTLKCHCTLWDFFWFET